MSIQLPRNQKELHFTGSVKALAPERPERPVSALGQQRPKGPLPTPLRTPAPDVYVAEAQPTPYFAARPSERAEAAQPVRATTVRGQLASFDDDQLTEALDRDIINASLFPVARRENASAAPLNLPVPHFRSAAEARAHHAPPAMIVRRPTSGGLPLSVWLIAALISGIVSYQLAPQAVASLNQVVRGSDSR
jgi:hypothetical protein